MALLRSACWRSQSDDQLRFTFTQPAEIRQIDVSVDISDRRAILVEFAVGINTAEGYGFDGRGFDRSANWLMHASWGQSPLGRGEIDETATLPAGVEVARGDVVGVSAWLGGVGSGDPISVSPEVVILYRWL
jgi:hypothetical protein